MKRGGSIFRRRDMEDTQKMPPGHYTDLPTLPLGAAIAFSAFLENTFIFIRAWDL